MLTDIKMKKKSVAELGHNGRLNIYVDPKKYTSILAFQSISPKWQGLQNDKIQAGREAIWPLLLNIAKPLKLTFPP